MSFLPHQCHSFRSTVIPSGLLSLLPDYCHSFQISVISSKYFHSFRIITISNICHPEQLRYSPIPEGREKWPPEVAIYASIVKSCIFQLLYISLSKWSNYPYNICEILAISQNNQWYFCQSFQVLICEKIKPPLTILSHVVKTINMKIFLWSKKHKFMDLTMFSKTWDIAKISWILFEQFWDSIFSRILYIIWIQFWDVEK